MSHRSLFSDSHLELSTVVRATDLIKIVNQIYMDKMACVRLTIVSSDKNEDLDGTLKIAALPSLVSDEMKEYSDISGMSTIDFPDEY